MDKRHSRDIGYTAVIVVKEQNEVVAGHLPLAKRLAIRRRGHRLWRANNRGDLVKRPSPHIAERGEFSPELPPGPKSHPATQEEENECAPEHEQGDSMAGPENSIHRPSPPSAQAAAPIAVDGSLEQAGLSRLLDAVPVNLPSMCFDLTPK